MKLSTTPSASMEVELTELNERIAKGEAIVEQIIRREEVEKHIEAKREQMKAAQEHVDVLEALVKMFGPGGIVKELLTSKMDTFSKPVSAAVETVTGGAYSVGFDEHDLSVQVTTRSSDGLLPVQNLSSSERLRIGIGIQLGLAKALGFPLIIIDNADWLDPDNRAFFSEALESFAMQGYQVVVLATGALPEQAEESEVFDFVELRG